MKKLLIILLSISLLSCEGNKDKLPITHRKISLSIHNGSGFDEMVHILECDSFKMQDGQHADIWIDGSLSKIVCTNIIVPYSKREF